MEIAVVMTFTQHMLHEAKPHFKPHWLHLSFGMELTKLYF